MARMADNTIDLNPWRPAVAEQVDHNRHTQVDVPFLRARLVGMIRLGRAASVLIGVGLVIGAMASAANGLWWPVYVAAIALAVLVCIAWAFSEPMDTLIDYQMAELADPFRDSEWRELARMKAANAPQPAPIPCVRVESVVRTHETGGMRTAYNDDLPGTPEQWRSLAGLVLRDTAPEPFSLRTAESVGLSREQWNTARDVFLARGWAGWNHPTDRRQGISLRLVGRRYLRALADHVPYEMVPTDDL